MKSLFFAIRRHFFRLVLQTNFAIVRLILANSHIARFVKKQLFVTTIALFQNNFNRKNPQNSGDFFLSIMHTNISSHILKVSLCHKILILAYHLLRCSFLSSFVHSYTTFPKSSHYYCLVERILHQWMSVQETKTAPYLLR